MRANDEARWNQFRRWIQEIDLSSAHILRVEAELYAALQRSLSRKRWVYWPIGELAEPVHLPNLIGDLLNGAWEEIVFQAGRVETLYRWLRDANNLAKADLDMVENTLSVASAAMSNLALKVDREVENFSWVLESFGSLANIDPSSTALVDVDSGYASLSPTDARVIDGVDVKLNRSETVGLPGANMLITSVSTVTGDREPVPMFEGNHSAVLGSVIDGSVSTWFEIERNFVKPKQRLIRLGRALVYSDSGEEMDVLTATKGHDWKVTVIWPDGVVDAGTDGKGVNLAEFIDFDASVEDTGHGASSTAQAELVRRSAARLSVSIVLPTPRPFSAVRITPLVRPGQLVTIRKVSVLVGDLWMDIASNLPLSSVDLSSTMTIRHILKKTGLQSTGAIFFVPTDLPVREVKIVLESPPIRVGPKLAHPFKEVLSRIRTEKRFFGIRTVRKRDVWAREPVGAVITAAQSASRNPFGDLGSAAVMASTIGTLAEGLVDLGSMRDGLINFGRILGGQRGMKTISSLGNTFTQIGSFLSSVMLGGDIIKALFGSKKTITPLDERVAWDIFFGWRASVALREVALLDLQYSDASFLTTKRRSFDRPVRGVMLFAEETIPETWGSGGWITYMISTDGVNFHPIARSPDRSTGNIFWFDRSVEHVWLRVEFRGNPDDRSRSPILKHVILKGIP